MLALSTNFGSKDAASGQALVDTLGRLGVGAVELEYRIGPAMWAEMKKPLKSAGIRVESVHNFFPNPGLVPGRDPSGDYFSLSSPDQEERGLAVEWTTRTLENAADAEARAVVLHLGQVDMASDGRTLHPLHRQGRIGTDEGREAVRERLAMRERLKGPHWDALLKALDRLMRPAEKYGLTLGLENRFHSHQLPSADEVAALLDEFAGGPLGYWHDVGHAHVQEVLTVNRPGELLERFGDRLVGLHLHDARGLDDHLPPGEGEVDWAAVEAVMGPETIRVMELAPGTPVDRVREGLETGWRRGW